MISSVLIIFPGAIIRLGRTRYIRNTFSAKQLLIDLNYCY